MPPRSRWSACALDLERQTGTSTQRIREAITLANNGIYEPRKTNPEWKGMACVLTVALIEDGPGHHRPRGRFPAVPIRAAASKRSRTTIRRWASARTAERSQKPRP